MWKDKYEIAGLVILMFAVGAALISLYSDRVDQTFFAIGAPSQQTFQKGLIPINKSMIFGILTLSGHQYTLNS